MNHENIVSLPCSADLSSSEFMLAKLTSTGVAVATSVTDRVIGSILRGNDYPSIGQTTFGLTGFGECAVKLTAGSIHYVKVGNTTAIAFGDELEQGTTDGTVVKRVGGEVIGISINAVPASSSGGFFQALLFSQNSSSGRGASTLTAGATLTAGDSGQTIFLNAAGGGAIVLPAQAVGMRFEFIIKTAPTTAWTITSVVSDTIIGYPIASLGSDETGNGNAAGDVLNFVANTALPSDTAIFTSDGTSWQVRATCKATGAITITG